jgi:hypothetical protein
MSEKGEEGGRKSVGSCERRHLQGSWHLQVLRLRLSFPAPIISQVVGQSHGHSLGRNAKRRKERAFANRARCLFTIGAVLSEAALPQFSSYDKLVLQWKHENDCFPFLDAWLGLSGVSTFILCTQPPTQVKTAIYTGTKQAHIQAGTAPIAKKHCGNQQCSPQASVAQVRAGSRSTSAGIQCTSANLISISSRVRTINRTPRMEPLVALR